MRPYHEQAGLAIYNGDVVDVAPHITERADCLIADPPFNAGKTYGPNNNDSRSQEEYAEWLEQRMAAAIMLCRPGAAVWVMNSSRNLAMTQNILEGQGLEFINLVCWIFGNPTPSRYHLPRTWRPILLMRVPGGHWVWNTHADRLRRETMYCNFAHINGDRLLADVWPDIPKLVGGYLAQPEVITDAKGNFRHLAQMPEALAQRPIMLSTNEDDLVVDPFMGSGTSLAAARRLGRRAMGIEIEEEHCATAVERLAQGILFH